MDKATAPVISLSYDKAQDGTWQAMLIVSGLVSERMAQAAVSHMQELFAGDAVRTQDASHE